MLCYIAGVGQIAPVLIQSLCLLEIVNVFLQKEDFALTNLWSAHVYLQEIHLALKNCRVQYSRITNEPLAYSVDILFKRTLSAIVLVIKILGRSELRGVSSLSVIYKRHHKPVNQIQVIGQ